MDAKKLICVATLLLILNGCASTGGLCSMGPFIPDAGAGDRWTQNEKRKLVARNNAGVEVCGWERPR